MEKVSKFFQKFFDLSQVALFNEDPLIQAISGILIFSLVATSIIFGLLIANRIVLFRKGKKINATKENLILLVSEYLFESDSIQLFRIRERLIGLSTSSNAAFFLRQILLGLYQNLKGEARDRLKAIFLETNAQRNALSQLKSGTWYEKIDVIRELTTMNISECYPEISRYRNDIHRDVRFEVTRAGIYFNKADAFEFLLENEPLTQWEIIRFIEISKHAESTILPNFAYFLKTMEPSVKVLCLRLIATFQQYSTEDEVIRCLSNKNLHVVLEAISTIESLQFYSAIHELEELLVNTDDTDIERALVSCLFSWKLPAGDQVLFSSLEKICRGNGLLLIDLLASDRDHALHGMISQLLPYKPELHQYYISEMHRAC